MYVEKQKIVIRITIVLLCSNYFYLQNYFEFANKYNIFLVNNLNFIKIKIC